MRSATGVQQREPSVLQVIVDSVSGMEGASHSSSSLTSAPRDDAGEKHSLNSICPIPHSGPCSCGERDCALERHRVVGVPPLANQARPFGRWRAVLYIYEGGGMCSALVLGGGDS